MKIFILLTISIFSTSFGNGQTSVASDNQDFEKSIITKEQSDLIFKNAKVFPNNTQISFAIIENGVARFYGIKRENDSIIYVENKKNVFEIGSISKVFTSTLLADFVIENKIGLDENINQYLKFSFKDNQKIKFRALANHTSGLPRLPTNLAFTLVNPTNPYEKYGEKELKEYLSEELELAKPTDNSYNYSNLGAGLLGYTLSKIANKSYQELLQGMIFSKYEMIPNWDLGVLAGAGAILSSVDDLSKFAIAQFDSKNRELELSITKTSTINENMDIGLGWLIIKKQSGENWIWHNGGTGGYTSSIAIDINNRNGIIILSNVSASSPNMGNIDKLCFRLLETLKGK